MSCGHACFEKLIPNVSAKLLYFLEKCIFRFLNLGGGISNLVIDANADYSSTITISSIASDGTETPFDLTGYTVSASVRKTFASATATAMDITIDPDPTTGSVTVGLTDVQTGALDRGRYVWDMIVTSAGGLITRVVQGLATVNPSVTRS